MQSFGHRADMLLFTKHNHCHYHRVLGFFVVIAMLYSSIGIGIGIARGQYYWILGAFLGIVLTLYKKFGVLRAGSLRAHGRHRWLKVIKSYS